MTVIQSIREYINTCSLFEGGVLHVDFLDYEAASYSVDITPGEPIIKSYLDGSSVRQLLFTVRSTMLYGNDIRQQLDNIAFFETFQEWLEEQQRMLNFPNLGTKKKCRKIEVTTYGYPFEEGTDYAAYQIQCRIEYLQEA